MDNFIVDLKFVTVRRVEPIVSCAGHDDAWLISLVQHANNVSSHLGYFVQSYIHDFSWMIIQLARGKLFDNFFPLFQILNAFQSDDCVVA
jgi:hypothetical protein